MEQEDRVTTQFQDKIALLTGKEAALFCVSGTMVSASSSHQYASLKGEQNITSMKIGVCFTLQPVEIFFSDQSISHSHLVNSATGQLTLSDDAREPSAIFRGVLVGLI